MPVKQFGLNRHHPELLHLAGKTFWIIYSKATGRIRRYTRPERADEVIQVIPGQGEAALELPMESWGSHLDLQPLLNKHTGIEPQNDRYAIVHPTGKVVGALIGDPLCKDRIEGHRLIAHAVASAGWTFHEVLGFQPPG